MEENGGVVKLLTFWTCKLASNLASELALLASVAAGYDLIKSTQRVKVYNGS